MLKKIESIECITTRCDFTVEHGTLHGYRYLVSPHSQTFNTLLGMTTERVAETATRERRAHTEKPGLATEQHTFQTLPIGNGIIHQILVFRRTGRFVKEGRVCRRVCGSIFFYLSDFSSVGDDGRKRGQLLVLGRHPLLFARGLFRHFRLSCVKLVVGGEVCGIVRH